MGDRGHSDRVGEYAWMARGVIRLIDGLLGRDGVR